MALYGEDVTESRCERLSLRGVMGVEVRKREEADVGAKAQCLFARLAGTIVKVNFEQENDS